jgi:hypothetical protein
MEILKQAARLLSRRAFARMLGGGALIGALKANQVPSGQLTWNADQAPSLSLERYYRADAHVIIFGVPVLHRNNVGGGSVLWREFDADGPARLLEFSGYSSPERAAGLNRIGFIREMARVDGEETIYFGLMTASPEDTADSARKALHSTAQEQAYTAIEGRISGSGTVTAVARFTAPTAISGAKAEGLVEKARRALAAAHSIHAPQASPEDSHSFLQALAELLSRSDRERSHFLYSGRRYQLRLTRFQDAKATTYFRRRGLIDESCGVFRFSGRVRNESAGSETEFRLWISSDGAKPLPLRIEYQAKPYLRLTFEAEG